MGRVALRDQLPVADPPRLDFGVIDLVAELSVRRGGFALAQNLGMRFEQTNHLCRGREGFPVEEATHGLLDPCPTRGNRYNSRLCTPWACSCFRARKARLTCPACA